jgi:hypothetical protein
MTKFCGTQIQSAHQTMGKEYIFQGMPSGTRQEENSQIDLGMSDIGV